MWISKDRKWYEIKGSKTEENRIRYRNREIMKKKDSELALLEEDRLRRGYCKICRQSMTVGGFCSNDRSHSQI